MLGAGEARMRNPQSDPCPEEPRVYCRDKMPAGAWRAGGSSRGTPGSASCALYGGGLSGVSRIIGLAAKGSGGVASMTCQGQGAHGVEEEADLLFWRSLLFWNIALSVPAMLRFLPKPSFGFSPC